MGIAGNKFDLFSIEEVTEEEGKQLADEIGAFFYLTSAKESVGINELFIEVAKRFINYQNNKQSNREDDNLRTKLSNKSLVKKNKCC